MSKPKRLHPVTILLKMGKYLKSSFIPTAIVSISGYRENKWLFFIPIIAVLFVHLLAAIVSWLRHTYQLDEEELRIEHGVFIRKKRYIPYERIQSIDISQGVLQRIFSLVKVQIETAGRNHHEGAEADLPAISKKEAQYIQQFFMNTKKSTLAATEEGSAMQVYRITPNQLLLLSLTSGGVGVVISAVLAFLSQLDRFIPYKKLFGSAEKAVSGSILATAVIVFAGFLILWIIAFIRTMLKYADFTVSKTDKDILITQGLLTRRELTIPINRIQMVRISENLLRQMFGLATVYIESAGGSAEYKEGARVMIVPLVKREQIDEAIKAILTDYHTSEVFHSIPKRAAQRYILRSWYIVIPIMIAAFLFLKLWGLFSLILLAAASLWSLLKYKDAGWSLEGLQLNFRWRSLNRNTVFMKKNRIQSLSMGESYFQRKKELATIEAFVKSGMGIAGGKITDISKEDMNDIYAWFIAGKKEDVAGS